MPRVLFVDHVDRILGGAEINLIELIEEAKKHGEWEIGVACRETSQLGKAVACQVFDYGFTKELNTLRFSGRALPLLGLFQGWRALSAGMNRLRNIAAEFRAEVMISCTNKDHFAVAAVSKQSRVPAVWWVNDLISSKHFSGPIRAAFRQQAAFAHSLVPVSFAVRGALRNLGLKDEKLRVIQNGIPLSRYRLVERGFHRKRLGLPNEAPLFGIVARICPWKGQKLFLQIAEKWIRAGEDGHFVIVGRAFNEDQEYQADLERIISDKGLSDRVHFSGFHDDVPAILSDLDTLLHTSERPEPFGRVIIEAMAVGVPVIAADDGGPREIIESGVNGLLAKVGDPTAYCEKLKQLLTQKDLAAHLRNIGRRTVETRFSIERVYNEFVDLLKALPSSDSGSATALNPRWQLPN